MAQEKQDRWVEQWRTFRDDELFLFKEWIAPNTLEIFRGKSVLEAGCGGGQHTAFVAPICNRLVAIDLNTIDLAIARNRDQMNVTFIEGDIATIDLAEKFDIVFSIGVVHHTDNPDQTVNNLVRHLNPGGRLILWVYSKEGNWIAENIVELFRKRFLRRSRTSTILLLSRVATAMMYLPIYSIYLLPITTLPYHEYFRNFRRLSFTRNVLNVFDKLNAPQVRFVSREEIHQWLSPDLFSDIHIARYRGVSWQASGTLRSDCAGY